MQKKKYKKKIQTYIQTSKQTNKQIKTNKMKQAKKYRRNTITIRNTNNSPIHDRPHSFITHQSSSIVTFKWLGLCNSIFNMKNQRLTRS